MIATCNQWLYDNESGLPTRICTAERGTEHDHDNAPSLNYVRVYGQPNGGEADDLTPAAAFQALENGTIYVYEDDGTFWQRPVTDA